MAESVYPDSPIDNVIYALKHRTITPTTDSAPEVTRNDLWWYQNKDFAHSGNLFENARRVGIQWDFPVILQGANGIVYTVTADGELLWHNHVGWPTGTFQWEGPRVIGTGWSRQTENPNPKAFIGFFCDAGIGGEQLYPVSRTVIYALRADGSLDWYRHDGSGDGTPLWANNGLPKTVGTCWNWENGLQRIFSGTNGIIYVIRQDGALYWHRHNGYLTGTTEWEAPCQIGSNWGGFQQVFSIGGGIIYAVEKDGTVLHFWHKGYKNGSPSWDTPKKAGVWRGEIVCNSVCLETTQ
ncbi:MAG: tachylectin-related carbohydrate-binding protein [Niabella sp.]